MRRTRNIVVVVGIIIITGCAIALQGKPELDPTDYEADREAVAGFYHRSAADYWARHGLPPLVRLSAQIRELEGDADAPFQSIRSGFRESAFLAAIESQRIPSSFSNVVNAELSAGRGAWPAFLAALRASVSVLDSARAAGNSQAAGSITSTLRAAFVAAFDSAAIARLAPEFSKTYVSTPRRFPRLLCQAGTTPFDVVGWVTAAPAPNDTTTSIVTNWTGISSVIWTTTYNASCAGQAVGPSAVKLGITGDGVSGPTMTCKDWNDLSRALGNTPGKAGAPMDGLARWYKSKGYCAKRAWNGPRESACLEAKRALDRGCDVLLYYNNSKGAHIEMVTSMNLDADSSGCTASTLSWGQGATAKVKGGRFSEKSDSARYGGWADGGGDAAFYYYCPCQ